MVFFSGTFFRALEQGTLSEDGQTEDDPCKEGASGETVT
jgi:hypothetical protein